eukprot:TRINITY_DN18088_c0_g1_i2.p1 TRINITY_DN18088_c0_g1~~TRINITY_DN18088_c0_g1_i2.p1  ORF type:complete len:232 (+),score=56.98 TRINITY_DN18088_c0_g1_i2:116-811(+)
MCIRDRGKTNTQGCFSRVVRIQEKFAFAIPKSIPSAQAAPLMCAGVTMWEPIQEYVTPAKRVGILGVGGLGHMGVQLAVAAGADVTALDWDSHKKDRTLAIGAHRFVDTENAEQLKDVAGTLDVVIDTLPVEKDLAPAMDLLNFGGTYVKVGLPKAGAELSYPTHLLVFTAKKIAGSIVCGSSNTNKMLHVCDSHKVHSDTRVVPFSQINEEIQTLLAGTSPSFRTVLEWD